MNTRKQFDIQPLGVNPDIDLFRAQCYAFCNAQAGRTNELAIAKTKVEELIYHLRRHREIIGATLQEEEPAP